MAAENKLCVPTWKGYIQTTRDALFVFQACFNGTLDFCLERPNNLQNDSLITSGNVFVYSEESGIKRWTDNHRWSPSRSLTNFLIYCEFPKTPSGKQVLQRSRRPPPKPETSHLCSAKDVTLRIGKSGERRITDSLDSLTNGSKRIDTSSGVLNRALVGALCDFAEFNQDGLLKKTISVTVSGKRFHLISYYNLGDVTSKLHTPKEDDLLKNVTIQNNLSDQLKFRTHNLDDTGDGSFDGALYTQGYPYQVYDPRLGFNRYPASQSQYMYHPWYAAPPPPSGSVSSTYFQMPPAVAEGYPPPDRPQCRRHLDYACYCNYPRSQYTAYPDDPHRPWYPGADGLPDAERRLFQTPYNYTYPVSWP